MRTKYENLVLSGLLILGIAKPVTVVSASPDSSSTTQGGQSCSFDPDCPTSAPFCNFDYSVYPQSFPDRISRGTCSATQQQKPLSCGLTLDRGSECRAVPGTTCVNIYANEGSEGVCLRRPVTTYRNFVPRRR